MWSAWWTISLCSLALLSRAQTLTVPDAAGDTVVEVVTTNRQGLPTTEIISSVVSPPTTTPTPTPPTTAPTTTPSTTTPAVQPGPVEQPAPTNPDPDSATPFTYTTTNAEGETTAVAAVFVPSFSPTTTLTPSNTGSILPYSQYVAMVGTNTVAANSASSRHSLDRGWYGAGISALAGAVGGAYLIFA